RKRKRVARPGQDGVLVSPLGEVAVQLFFLVVEVEDPHCDSWARRQTGSFKKVNTGQPAVSITLRLIEYTLPSKQRPPALPNESQNFSCKRLTFVNPRRQAPRRNELCYNRWLQSSYDCRPPCLRCRCGF